MNLKAPILMTEFVTHDVNRFVLTKQKGFKFVPGQGAAVFLNGTEIGLLGTVAEPVRARFDLGQVVTVAELDVEPLLALAGEPKGDTERPGARAG